MLNLGIKRIYVAPAAEDGMRVLVDRLWPRGITKEAAAVDYWARDIAPSNELRKWYAHDPAKWPGFRERYFAELDANGAAVQALREQLAQAGQGHATLLFQSKEEELNNAVALLAYLQGTGAPAENKRSTLPSHSTPSRSTRVAAAKAGALAARPAAPRQRKTRDA